MPVPPGGVAADHAGLPGVVRRRPVPDAGVGLGRRVRAEVVEHDRDPDLGRVQAARVAHEGQELGAALALGDVPVEPVGAQVVVAIGCRLPFGGW